MNARLVRQLVNFYPQEWRTRYGEEFQSFLETHPANLQTVLNIIGGAMHERVLSLRRFKMDRRQNSLTLMLYASLGALAAGTNYSALFTSWNLVRAGSLLALAAFATVGIPL
jgi:hypothetical protein